MDECVSFDGTWAKRGHSSLFGVQAILHMETGKVLDTQVHSKLCNICCAKEETLPDKTSDAYITWYEGHKPACTRNTEVSSNAMEAQGAKEMWNRSVEKNRMRYTTFVGDGDSKAYETVCDEKPYGDVEIKKADCIGHVQKRMGSRLRDWRKGRDKLEDGKSVGGKGRFTVGKMDKMQTYYGMAIRNNIPNVNAMSTATTAILHHSVLPFTPSKRQPYPKKQMEKKPPNERITEEQWEEKETERLGAELIKHQFCDRTVEDQHQYCPDGADTWCKWKKAKFKQAEKEKEREEETDGENQEESETGGEIQEENETEQVIDEEKEKEKKEEEKEKEKEEMEALAKKGLPHCFYDELKPIYDRLSDAKLLERCKDGYTQNQNESFNGLVWNHAPKHKFFGYIMIRSAANLAAGYFNDGAEYYANVMTAMNIPPNSVSLKAFHKMDKI